MNKHLILLLGSCLACSGCDVVHQYYKEYKRSRLVQVASFAYDDNDVLIAVQAEVKTWPIDVAMEGDLGAMAVYVDRDDKARARELIEQSCELRRCGVTLVEESSCKGL